MREKPPSNRQSPSNHSTRKLHGLLRRACFFSLLRSERGRSLPAALIALAVGSLLITPFLSFVSSRSIGTRSAAETFQEQYAADAGIEFGIWALLNDPATKAQVDAAGGTPVSVPFPETINGVNPTVTLTANPSSAWVAREPVSPDNAGPGGALEHTGGNSLYALMGDGTRTFKRYDRSNDSWTNIITIPWYFYWNSASGDMTYAGGNDIYTFFSGYYWINPFYRHSTAGNTWHSLDYTPEEIRPGAAIVYAGGNDLYSFRGGGRTFWRYDIGSETWEEMKRLKGNASAEAGSALVYTGGDYLYALMGGGTTDFLRFDEESGQKGKWETMEDTPLPVGGGGSLTYAAGDDYIYALQGGGERGFWRYIISSDTWEILVDTPAGVGPGGDLVFVSANTGYALRGGDNPEFWEYTVSSPRYDIQSQAGSVTIQAQIELDGPSPSILFWDIE